MAKIGIDCSHWNSPVNWQKAYNNGVRFAYLKCSQGTGYRDDTFATNYDNARKVGIKVGAYHFCTTDPGVDQYKWFRTCMGDRKFDLRPALDCEAYTGIQFRNEFERVHGMRIFPYLRNEELEVYPVRELAWGKPDMKVVTCLSEALGYSYPRASEVWAMGSLLVNYQGWQYSAIYTNWGSGNVIFGNDARFKRFPLWVANWGVSKPTLPTVWAGEKYYVWQDGVVDGAPYGVSSSKVDHNVWGNLLPFPGEEPPAPIEDDYLEVMVEHMKSGREYVGRLNLVE